MHMKIAVGKGNRAQFHRFYQQVQSHQKTEDEVYDDEGFRTLVDEDFTVAGRTQLRILHSRLSLLMYQVLYAKFYISG